MGPGGGSIVVGASCRELPCRAGARRCPTRRAGVARLVARRPDVRGWSAVRERRRAPAGSTWGAGAVLPGMDGLRLGCGWLAAWVTGSLLPSAGVDRIPGNSGMVPFLAARGWLSRPRVPTSASSSSPGLGGATGGRHGDLVLRSSSGVRVDPGGPWALGSRGTVGSMVRCVVAASEPRRTPSRVPSWGGSGCPARAASVKATGMPAAVGSAAAGAVIQAVAVSAASVRIARHRCGWSGCSGPSGGLHLNCRARCRRR